MRRHRPRHRRRRRPDLHRWNRYHGNCRPRSRSRREV